MATSSDNLGRPCSDSSSWLHHHYLLSIENDPLMMSSGAAAPQMITRSVLLPPTDPQHENETSSSSADPRAVKRKKKKKSRSSSSRKNSLTTFIAADPANFRHMVQQITGGTTGNAAPILKPAPQRPGGGLMPAPQSADHGIGGGFGFEAGFPPCFPVLESHVNISALVSSSTYHLTTG